MYIIHFLLAVNYDKKVVQTHFLLLFVNKKYPETYILYYESKDIPQVNVMFGLKLSLFGLDFAIFNTEQVKTTTLHVIDHKRNVTHLSRV